MAPMPSISTRTRSPTAGSAAARMPCPTPGGVPGEDQVARLERDRLGDERDQVARRRRPCWRWCRPGGSRRSPGTGSPSACGSGISSAVTIHGPIGANVSSALPRIHCVSPNCRSRAEMSSPHVYPSTTSSARSSGTRRRGPADHHDELGLVVERCGDRVVDHVDARARRPRSPTWRRAAARSGTGEPVSAACSA